MEEREVAALAAKAKAGNMSAFERLYSEHARSILFHVRNLLVDKESYTDVAQDVALKMFEKIHTLREPAAFRGWMHQIVRNECATHNSRYLTRNAKTDPNEDDEALESVIDEGEDVNPETLTMEDLEGNWLYLKVSELPLLYREIILQFYYDGMSYKDIAQSLDISVTNVSARLRRAMEALRTKIGEASENADAPGKDIRDSAMREDTYTQHAEDNLTVDTDPKLREKGLEDDIGLKSSLSAAALTVVTDDTTHAFVESVQAKIAATTGAPAASSAAGTAASTGKGITVAGCLISSLVFVVALVFGGLAIFSGEGLFGQSATGDPQGQTETIQYQGTAHIVFADASGNDGDHNIQSATLAVEGTEPAATEWTLYLLSAEASGAEEGINSEEVAAAGSIDIPAEAALVNNGKGTIIDSTALDSLQAGSYQLVFTLIDEEGARADITRTFVITE